MAVFEMESWFVAEGKEKQHDDAMRGWLIWVRAHRELFREWKSVRYFVKHVAGDDSNRHFLLWEYDSLADYEAYKKRRANYEGPYVEYKKYDPYYMDVFNHSRMGLEFWRDKERELWIEEAAPAPAEFKSALPLAGVREQVTFLYYPDLTAPREFYGKVLGLESYYDQDWASLYRVAAGAAIGVVKSSDKQVAADVKRDAAMISIVTTDVDDWFSRLKQVGGVVVQKGIYDHPSVPIRAFLLRDPGGYSVEFFQWLKPVGAT
jgi:predicted enzyme related to lactoylglutathione lyase